jgi:GTPase SAR1 family protein
MIDRWIVEIKHHNPDAPFVLCCNKVDLLDPSKAAMAGVPVPDDFDVESAKAVLKDAQKHSQTEPGCAGFFACSALTQENLKTIFDTAIRVGLSFQRGELRPAPPTKPRRLCNVL